MRQSSPGSWRRSIVGASLALLTAALVTPGRIEAGCAHYVIWKGVAQPAPLGLELLGPDAFAPAESRFPVLPTDGHPPCTGVLCSGAPATPEIPPSTGPPRAELWGVLSEPAPPAPGVATFECPDEGTLSLVLEGSGVFHPPRIIR